MNWINGRPDDWDIITEGIARDFLEMRSITVNKDVFESSASAMLAALIKWLNEPCDKHLAKKDEDLSLILCVEGTHWRFEHRYLCPQCMEELKEGVK